MAISGSRAHSQMNQGTLDQYSLFLAECFLMKSHLKAATSMARVKRPRKMPRDKQKPSPFYQPNP